MSALVGAAQPGSEHPRESGLRTDLVQPGTLFHASSPPVTYRQHFTPASAQLQYLSCGEFELSPAATSREFQFPGEETLLFMWQGSANA